MTETTSLAKKRTFQYVSTAIIAAVLFSFINGGSVGLRPVIGVIPTWMALVIAGQILVVISYFYVFDHLIEFALPEDDTLEQAMKSPSNPTDSDSRVEDANAEQIGGE